jgi:hypothetical protein
MSLSGFAFLQAFENIIKTEMIIVISKKFFFTDSILIFFGIKICRKCKIFFEYFVGFYLNTLLFYPGNFLV